MAFSENWSRDAHKTPPAGLSQVPKTTHWTETCTQSQLQTTPKARITPRGCGGAWMVLGTLQAHPQQPWLPWSSLLDLQRETMFTDTIYRNLEKRGVFFFFLSFQKVAFQHCNSQIILVAWNIDYLNTIWLVKNLKCVCACVRACVSTCAWCLLFSAMRS